MSGWQERERLLWHLTPGERCEQPAVLREHLLQLLTPGWRSPWLSFNVIRRRVDNRQAEPRGVGGDEEEEPFYFHPRSLISSNWGLCLEGWIHIVL